VAIEESPSQPATAAVCCLRPTQTGRKSGEIITRAVGSFGAWKKGDGRRELFVLSFPVGLQNGRPCGIDVGHQVMGLLIAAIGVVPLGEAKICRGEILRRY
jgi:hypothetical protein